MNNTTDKTVDIDKKLDTAADKNLNAVANKAVNADKSEDAITGKQPNTTAKLSMLIKDEIIRRTKLRGWIGVG